MLLISSLILISRCHYDLGRRLTWFTSTDCPSAACLRCILWHVHYDVERLALRCIDTWSQVGFNIIFLQFDHSSLWSFRLIQIWIWLYVSRWTVLRWWCPNNNSFGHILGWLYIKKRLLLLSALIITLNGSVLFNRVTTASITYILWGSISFGWRVWSISSEETSILCWVTCSSLRCSRSLGNTLVVILASQVSLPMAMVVALALEWDTSHRLLLLRTCSSSATSTVLS